MSREENVKKIVKLLEKIALKFGGEDGEKMVKHFDLIEGVFEKLGVILQDDNLFDKLDNCTNDELEVINSRLTMIINTLKDKEVK